MSNVSASDARLAVFRKIRQMFLDLLNDGSGQRSAKQIEEDEQLVDELSTEMLDVLGFEIVSVDDDGSMIIRLNVGP